MQVTFKQGNHTWSTAEKVLVQLFSIVFPQIKTHQNDDGFVSPSDFLTVLTALPNASPSFVKGADQHVTDESGPQTIAAWATPATTNRAYTNHSRAAAGKRSLIPSSIGTHCTIRKVVCT